MLTPLKISDARNMPDASRDGKVVLPSISGKYSSSCGWNRDSSMMLLNHYGYFAVYSGDGKYLSDLPFEISGDNANPVWSRSERVIVYFVSGNSVKSCDVVTRKIALVRQFTEYSRLVTFGESDISDDGKYLVLAGDGKHVFTLNLETKDKSTSAELPGIESIHLTPKNHVLVKYHTNGNARHNGCELLDRHMTFLWQVLEYNAHADIMLDASGKEILIHGNGAAQIVSTRLLDAANRDIFKSISGLAEHISCPIGKDFFFMDRYDPKGVMEGDILKVWLDGKSEVLALHGSKPFPGNTYTYQPKVSCNRDGTKIVFGSNMGIGVPPNYSDVYMMTLAAAAEKPVPVPVSGFPKKFGFDKYRATIDSTGITIYEVKL